MQDLLANPLKDWITALITTAMVFAVLILGRMFVARRVKHAEVPPSQLRALLTDLVRRTRLYFMIVIALWAGVVVGFWVERIAEHRDADAGTRMTINVVGIAVRVLLWTVVLLVISIVLDKPIVVGDAISVGDVSGTVLHIGLKSTRLRANSGELVIISNGDLLRSRIRNFRGQERRLVQLKLGIAYGTPAEKLAKVPQIIRSAAQNEKNVTFDRSNFTSFEWTALITDSLYYVSNSSYAEYMDIQQRINLEILRQLAAESIEIAHQLPIIASPHADPPT